MAAIEESFVGYVIGCVLCDRRIHFTEDNECLASMKVKVGYLMEVLEIRVPHRIIAKHLTDASCRKARALYSTLTCLLVL